MGPNNLFRNNYCLLGLLHMPVVLWFCEMSFLSVWSSLCLAVWLWTALPEINFCKWLEIYKNQGPYLLKKNFQVFWKMLSFKFVTNDLKWKFLYVYFLVANPPCIYSGKFLILICYPKIFSTNQNTGFSKLTQKYTWDNGAVRLICFLVTRHLNPTNWFTFSTWFLLGKPNFDLTNQIPRFLKLQ